MNAHQLELADIFRSLDPCFLDTLSAEHKRVVRDITLCRTAALGGHVEQCDTCGHQVIAYNSCRNRHCAKCQAAARAEWLEERAAELLPTDYFHVVFTLPHQLAPLALQNKRVVYGLLFRAAAETLVQIAADPQHLGAEIGFLAVLHTWGQNLHHHPHLHCVVPGGGLSPDGERWISCRKGFFLPVKVLSRLFRGKFVAYLRQAFEQGELLFDGGLHHLAEAVEFSRLMREVSGTEWVVYAKPPFGGPAQVLKYLARYTHRVAISNQRLVSLEAGEVTFRWKDYSQGNGQKEMTLTASEFTRRFLLHVLPAGFMRIRHYGFLANRCRSEKLARCRKLLAAEQEQEAVCGAAHQCENELATLSEAALCPVCRHGHMRIIEMLEPHSAKRNEAFSDTAAQDSS